LMPRRDVLAAALMPTLLDASPAVDRPDPQARGLLLAILTAPVASVPLQSVSAPQRDAWRSERAKRHDALPIAPDDLERWLAGLLAAGQDAATVEACVAEGWPQR
jgi:hypothetical protein